MGSALRDSLDMIGRVFDIDGMLNARLSKAEIVEYYTQSDSAYELFHSPQGARHMALCEGSRFDRAAFLTQPRMVDELIAQQRPSLVLELGSGKGFNSIFLAMRWPSIQFAGIELTPVHVDDARRRSAALRNVAFVRGDFEGLPFRRECVDLIFEVESICHADDMGRVLGEARRVLRPGGTLVVFDGFRKCSLEEVEGDLRTAARLVEASLAVTGFCEINTWRNLAERSGFRIDVLKEYTAGIMPNVMRYQRLAKAYFRHWMLSRVLLACLPPRMVGNALAGLLMPLTVRNGVHGYYSIVLRRN